MNTDDITRPDLGAVVVICDSCGRLVRDSKVCEACGKPTKRAKEKTDG